MLPTKINHSSISLTLQDPSEDCMELSRLLAAAVISPRFCDLLLKDPQAALERGYQGETFCFSQGQRDLILSIRSDSLADLACKCWRTFNEELPVVMSPARKTEYLVL